MPAGSGDRWPDDYERGRPGWPREVVTLAHALATATVLDLGAGTGKLTRMLVREFAHVIAVEPSDAMRQVLERICPEADARAGTGTDIPLADNSVDVVFAAQAFHWFDDDRALREIARVLRPGCTLVLMWNIPAGPWEPSTERAEDILRPRVPDGVTGHDPLDLGGPHLTDGNWRGSFASAGFAHPAQQEIANPQTLDREGLVAFFASMGWLADLADHERLPLLAAVRAELDAAQYRRVWTTHVYTTRLRDA